MQLISVQFVAFLIVMTCAYYVTGRYAPKLQWLAVLVGNFAFYLLASAHAWTALLIVAVALVTWAAARRMDALAARSRALRKQTRDRAERKALKQRLVRDKRRVLVAALVLCLAVLSYFKYANVVLFNLHLTESPTSLGIILPMGLSFYLLQSLSYLIDVYNERFAPEASFLRYLTFVSYFPQMTQGPINRWQRLSGEMFEPHRFDLERMRRALLRIGLGLFKKIAIAGALAGNVSAITSRIDHGIPGVVAAFGVVLYSFQMYGDFSGGIDVVEGVSELLGIEMDQNFRQPYLAVSLADFWRRWHMSLGVFMREYVFYPIAVTTPFRRLGKWGERRLGRQIGRTLPACVANVLVFLLVGVWHGAEWHYLAWGIANGAIVALSDLLAPLFARMREAVGVKGEGGAAWHAFCVVRTFLVVCFCRFLDYVPHVGTALVALRATFLDFMPHEASVPSAFAAYGVSHPHLLGLVPAAACALAVLACVDVAYERGHDVRSVVLSWGFFRRLAVYLVFAALIAATLPETVTGGAGFLYANF